MLTEKDWTAHAVQRFAWLRQQRSTKAPLNPSEQTSHLQGLTARALERCRESLNRGFGDGSEIANIIREATTPDADQRLAELQRLVAVGELLMHSTSQMSKALSQIRFYLDTFEIKPVYEWRPLNATSFVALFDDGFFTSTNSNDKRFIEELRRDPGRTDMAVNRHELLWARSDTGVVDANGDAVLTETYQDQGGRLELTAQFRADIDFYVKVANVMTICESVENAISTVAIELVDFYSDIEPMSFFIDELCARTLVNFRDDEPDNPAFRSGEVRNNFARAYYATSERGRDARYERIAKRINEIKLRSTYKWDIMGTDLKHLLYRDKGMFEEAGRLEFTRDRVKLRWQTALMESRDQALFVTLFMEGIDAMGAMSDEDREAGALEADTWTQGITLEWADYTLDHLWLIDAVIEAMTDTAEVMGFNSDGQDMDQTAVGKAEFEGLRRRTENQLKKVFPTLEDYNPDEMQQYRDQDKQAKLLQPELDRLHAVAKNPDPSKIVYNEYDSPLYDEDGDPWDAYFDMMFRIENLTPWLDDERRQRRDAKERKREYSKRVREGSKVAKKMRFAGLLPVMEYNQETDEVDTVAYLDEKTGKRYKVDSEQLEDEVARRNQGIPRKYWNAGERDWTPGDKRRLEGNGALLPMPEEPLAGQSREDWQKWADEYEATLKLKAENEEKERQIELDRKRREDDAKPFKGFSITTIGPDGVSRKSRSRLELQQVHALHERMAKQKREEASRAYRDKYEREHAVMLAQQRARAEEIRKETEDRIRRDRKHREWMEEQEYMWKHWPPWPPPPPPPPPAI